MQWSAAAARVPDDAWTGLRLLGIDIGGTRSRARLWAGGQVAAESQAASASLPAAGLEGARAALDALLTDVHADQAEPLDAICVGSAGLSVPGTREFLHARLTPLAWPGRVVIVSDVMLILPAARYDAGVAVVCGTGSVAVGCLAGRVIQAGGWGYLLGDEGGGYWIVREALRVLLGRRDQDEPLGELAAVLLAATGCENLSSLHRRYYEKPHRPSDWARHAEPVLDSRDPAATVIAGRAADAVAALASAAVSELTEVPAIARGDGRPAREPAGRCGPGSPASLPVVLAGGLLGSAVYRDAAANAVALALPGADVSVLADVPVAGAVRLAGLAATARGSPAQGSQPRPAAREN